jgi:transposase
MRKVINYIVKDKDVYIGLEDSKKTWKLCVRSSGMEVRLTSMPASYSVLRAFLRNSFPGCKIHLIYEASFRGFNLYDRLTEDGVECVVIPPHLVTEPKINKVKTDKRDARRLAQILENKDYRTSCYVPDKERREDRQISRTLICIQKDIVAVKNRILKLLEFHGIEVSIPDRNWTKQYFISLKNLKLSTSLRFSLDILIEELEHLCDMKERLCQALKELTKKQRYEKTYQLIKSMPGIGWLTSIRLVLEWGEDLSRFKRSNQIASFVGLTSSEYSSGETVRRGRITGQGRSFVRAWLIECAWGAIRKDPALLDKFNRVWKNSGSKKKAIVAVARTMTVRLRSCVLNESPYVVGVVQ